MKRETADYLADMAESMGLVNWSIDEYTPEGHLSVKVLAFQFDGVADLPRFRRRLNAKKLQGTRTVIDTQANRITMY
jgi:hypothetical protein